MQVVHILAKFATNKVTSYGVDPCFRCASGNVQMNRIIIKRRLNLAVVNRFVALIIPYTREVKTVGTYKVEF